MHRTSLNNDDDLPNHHGLIGLVQFESGVFPAHLTKSESDPFDQWQRMPEDWVDRWVDAQVSFAPYLQPQLPMTLK